MKIIGQVETNLYLISFKASLSGILGCFLGVPLLRWRTSDKSVCN